MKKIVVLSGAGISAESGINTFRGQDGLWEGHDIMEVASPIGWNNNPELVLDFYNQRRKQLKEVEPNFAHHAITQLESKYQVQVITQNVDDLHERAVNSDILHLHGELKKVRSTGDENLIYEWEDDLNLGDTCEKGFQLRPHIVWFGEMVPMLPIAELRVSNADIVIIIGTSMLVYPAAGLIHYAPHHAEIYYIDPKPNINYELGQRPFKLIEKTGTEGMKQLLDEL